MRDKLQIYSVITLFVAILIGFQLTSRMSSSKRLSPSDPNSYSRPDIAKVTHIHLALDVDFDRKILAGSATLSVEKIDSAATQVILDARGMKIASAVDDSNGANLDFV